MKKGKQYISTGESITIYLVISVQLLTTLIAFIAVNIDQFVKPPVPFYLYLLILVPWVGDLIYWLATKMENKPLRILLKVVGSILALLVILYFVYGIVATYF